MVDVVADLEDHLEEAWLEEEEACNISHQLQQHALLSQEDVVEDHDLVVETDNLLQTTTVTHQMSLKQMQKQINNFTKQHFDSLSPNAHASCSEQSLVLPDFEPVDFESDNLVGGRVSRAHFNWPKVTSSPWVLRVVKYGYELEFHTLPPLTSIPIFEELDLPPIQHNAVSEQVSELLTQGAVELAPDPFTPRFYSKLFVREKKTTGPTPEFRLIIDLSKLNEFLIVPHFTMESNRSVRRELRPGHFFCKFDLRHAYLHILIHPKHRKYLSFTHQGKVYQWTCLPFGLATSPFVFTKVIAEIAKFVHKRGITLIQFLDDWIMLCLILKLTYLQRNYLLQILWFLGWLVNMIKSVLEPLQYTDYLGAHYNSITMMVYPTSERWVKIQHAVSLFLNQKWAFARDWCRILGLLTSSQEFTSLGRLSLRPIQFHLNSKWKGHRQNLFHKIFLSPQCREALQWWLNPANVTQGILWTPPPPTVTITTDSSLHAYGAHMGTLSFSGTWAPVDQQMSINYLELKCILLALKHWQHLLQNSSILVRSDNQTALAYIAHQGGTRSWTLYTLARDIWQLIHSLHSWISVQFISGCHNTYADLLSRPKLFQATEWSLHPQVVQSLFAFWGTPHLDLFASQWNHKLPLYCSIIPDPLAHTIDSLSLNWEGLDAYAYPPPRLLPQVIQKIEQEPCVIILICPIWPKAQWYTHLLDLLVDFPIQLPQWKTLLKQPRTAQVYHPHPSRLNLHACRLSAHTYLREGFLKKLSNASYTDTDTLQTSCTMPNGPSTFIGVIRGVSILSNPLKL